MARSETIKVLSVRCDKAPRVIVETIPNTLEAFQERVGGLIEVFHPCGPVLDFICNEEGKLLDLQPNIHWLSRGFAVDTICGNVIVCRHDEEGNFADIQESDVYRVTTDLYSVNKDIAMVW